MATLKVRHLVAKANANGSTRYYWQPSAELRGAGWRVNPLGQDQPAAIARAEQLNAEVDAWRAGAPAPGAPPTAARKGKAAPAGSVEALVAAYKRSRWWLNLAPATHDQYGRCLDAIVAWAGDQPARAITPPAVQAFYEAQLRHVEGTGRARRVVETPAKAAAAVRVLRLLLQAGERLGYLSAGQNPARRPGITVTRQREPRPWSDAEVAHLAATADAMGWRSLGTAIILNAWIGQREGDLLRFAPWAFEADALTLRQAKRGRKVVLPVYRVPHLVARLKGERDRPGAVVSSAFLLLHEGTGRAWNPYTFRHVFAEVRAKAGAGDAALGVPPMPSCAGLILRELRHTAVTRLHEAGVDDLGISGITGHAPGTVKAMCDKHYLVRTEKAALRAFDARLKADGDGHG